MHLLFHDQTQWSGYFSSRDEILAYIQRVVDKYKLMKYIRLEHELRHAEWDEDSGKWHVRIRRLRNGASPTQTSSEDIYEEFEDTADLLFLATGVLSRWEWPDIEGLKNFKGKLFHTAQWDMEEDGMKSWGDKTVGIVGMVGGHLLLLFIEENATSPHYEGLDRHPNRDRPAAACQTFDQLYAREDMGRGSALDREDDGVA